MACLASASSGTRFDASDGNDGATRLSHVNNYIKIDVLIESGTAVRGQ